MRSRDSGPCTKRAGPVVYCGLDRRVGDVRRGPVGTVRRCAGCGMETDFPSARLAPDRRRLAWVSPGDALALRLVDRAEAMQAYARERRVDRVLEQFLRLAGGARD